MFLEVGMADGSAASMGKFGCAWKQGVCGGKQAEVGSGGDRTGGSGCERFISCRPAAPGALCTACHWDCGDERGILGRRGAVHTQSLYLDMFFPVLTKLDDRALEWEAF